MTVEWLLSRGQRRAGQCQDVMAEPLGEYSDVTSRPIRLTSVCRACSNWIASASSGRCWLARSISAPSLILQTLGEMPVKKPGARLRVSQ
jgi:hypothetical protein